MDTSKANHAKKDDKVNSRFFIYFITIIMIIIYPTILGPSPARN